MWAAPLDRGVGRCGWAGQRDPLIDGNVGAAMRKGDPLLSEMSAAIKALRHSGTYKTINDTCFKFDVFGS